MPKLTKWPQTKKKCVARFALEPHWWNSTSEVLFSCLRLAVIFLNIYIYIFLYFVVPSHYDQKNWCLRPPKSRCAGISCNCCYDLESKCTQLTCTGGVPGKSPRQPKRILEQNCSLMMNIQGENPGALFLKQCTGSILKVCMHTG